MSREHELDPTLSAYLDGALPEEQQADLRARLAASPALRARLAELAAVDEALRALPGPVAGEALKQRLRARIAEGAPATSPRARRPGRAAAPPSRRHGALRWAARASFAASALFVAWVAVGPSPLSSPQGPADRVPAPSDAVSSAIPDDFLVSESHADLEVIGVLDLLAGLDGLDESEATSG